MSIISMYETDQSDALCRRFATLASSYFDQQDAARSAGASVPLENLFRLLEMFRHRAYADENRKGVLAMELVTETSPYVEAEKPWHPKISNAIDLAIHSCFAEIPEDQAIRQLEQALHWLATNSQRPDQRVIEKSKKFFSVLAEQLT